MKLKTLNPTTGGLKRITLFLLLIPLCVVLLGTGCDDKDESEPLLHNITLYDKPLSVIQQYITGDWKLQYQIGGIAGSKYIDESNSYMNLTQNHIIVGNDLYEVVIDTSIVWKRELIREDEYSYLMGYPNPGWQSPTYFIINQIKNDTLIIIDYNVSDGFTYYYTRN
uniref:hypothetical protein n=1 Tax=uncultured Draconibacterium sp. TaxID=1573823 RepID=UPI003217ED84